MRLSLISCLLWCPVIWSFHSFTNHFISFADHFILFANHFISFADHFISFAKHFNWFADHFISFAKPTNGSDNPDAGRYEPADQFEYVCLFIVNGFPEKCSHTDWRHVENVAQWKRSWQSVGATDNFCYPNVFRSVIQGKCSYRYYFRFYGIDSHSIIFQSKYASAQVNNDNFFVTNVYYII